ncbi:MAG: helix-hairpin-helix domain-containing protein [Campylobacteraceae bacterium]|nr:helix-hairpin-helix domain-containing protein [Campylobacteraceae bacterium]
MRKIILGMFLSALLLLASINVNTAGKNELMTIKGIGEKKAELLIVFRKSNKITNLNDLSKIKGFGPKLIANIKNDVKKKSKKESKSMNMMKSKK